MSKKHALCICPYTQLFIQSSGRVYPCAFLQNNEKWELGNVYEKNLKDIWTSPHSQAFRKNHLEGQLTECATNQDIYQCHKVMEKERVMPEEKINPPLTYLDFMVDSKCNLKCIMCTNVLEESTGFNDESFWKHMEEEIFPELKEIELIGGEPFILPNTFRTIDLIAKVNPDCLWVITTNGSYRLSSAMKESLSKINIKSLAYSIDSLKSDVFQKIRPGGKLSQVLDTLDDFIAFQKELPPERLFRLEVNFVVQQDNAYEVPSFLEFVRGKKLIPYLIFLNYPDDYSLIKWPAQKQEDLLEFYLSDFQKSSDPDLLKLAVTLFRKMPASSRIKFSKIIEELS